MTRWEYRIEYLNIGPGRFPQMTDAWLNQLGADGWELVTFTWNEANRLTHTLVFKRPKP